MSGFFRDSAARTDGPEFQVVVTNCHQGMARAGRFVAEQLYTARSRIMLLQTFQLSDDAPGEEARLYPLLRSIAERELDDHKSAMVKQYHLPAEQILTRVEEGDLTQIITRESEERQEISVTLGIRQSAERQEITCLNTIHSLLDSPVRPFYLVAETIAVFHASGKLTLLGPAGSFSGHYYAFLCELAEQRSYRVETKEIDYHKNHISWKQIIRSRK